MAALSSWELRRQPPLLHDSQGFFFRGGSSGEASLVVWATCMPLFCDDWGWAGCRPTAA